MILSRANTPTRDWAVADRKSTLVFCVNLAHVRQLTKTFQDFGVEARYLHSGTPANERRALITDFKAGSYPVLVNCGTSTQVLV
jgi:ATP-dependent helicase IRC3